MGCVEDDVIVIQLKCSNWNLKDAIIERLDKI